MRHGDQLPLIDFNRINMLRVNHNTFGTGAKLRENLLAIGGASKFFRTKRQNIILNKPLSMFESTHLQTSSKAQMLADPEETAMSIIKNLDTSFCEKYDEPGVDPKTLRGISMNQISILDDEFDYQYIEEMEGTSARNIKRKCKYVHNIDHLKNPNNAVSSQMKKFFSMTRTPTNMNTRDTSIE